MPTALVTGATSGIGSAFTRRLSAEGYDLVVVARDGGRLEQAAEELRRVGGREVEVLQADLTDPDACAMLGKRLADPDHPVDLLVNNAGAALRKPFLANDVRDEERLLDLLVRAPMLLCRAALPGMVERRRGAVLNVSSVAGWTTAGTYAAAKSWLTTFTESLSVQLDGTGVSAMALCPGFVRTEFHERMGLDPDRMGPRWAWLDADMVVDRALKDLRAGRVVSVPSARYRVVSAAARHVPLRYRTRVLGRRY